MLDEHQHVTAIGEYMQHGGIPLRRRMPISGMNDAAHGDHHAVALGADQFVVGGRHRLGNRPMALQCDALAENNGAETSIGLTPYQNVITGNQLGIRLGVDVHTFAVVL